MAWNAIKALIREDHGMEMVEWSIVGMVFAVASAILWTLLKDPINTALNRVGNCVSGGVAGCS